MSEPIRYRGRTIHATDIAFIQALIDQHRDLSRRRLSAQLCTAWNWVQPNGALRDMVARGLLLVLHRAGHIQLPPKRCSPPNNAIRHRAVPAATLPSPEPWTGSLAELGALDLRLVRRTEAEALFAALLQAHHYLGYTRPVGEHLKYLVYAQDRPIACLAWSSAPRHLGPRDRFIGWSPEVRRRHLHLVAYNTRFLILPWMDVRDLASHLLGRMARRLSADWQAVYHHPIHLLETFIDPARFVGTCYRAANWIRLGQTTGRGHNARTSRCDQPRKELWVYPLGEAFRAHLLRADG